VEKSLGSGRNMTEFLTVCYDYAHVKVVCPLASVHVQLPPPQDRTRAESTKEEHNALSQSELVTLSSASTTISCAIDCATSRRHFVGQNSISILHKGFRGFYSHFHPFCFVVWNKSQVAVIIIIHFVSWRRY